MDKKVVSNMRRWIDAIARQNLAGIIPELREFVATCACEKTVNKMLNKLFQHLAHAASKVDRSNVEFGKQLQEIAHLICYSVTSVPSNKNFSACMYHIVACLLDMKLYYEGMDICDYLLPKHGLCKPDATITRMDMYDPISIVWYKTATNLLSGAESLDNETYKLFESMVNLDLKLTRSATDESSFSVVSRVYSYAKRAMHKGDSVYNERIKDSLLRYVEKCVFRSEDEKIDQTWNIVIELIVLLIGKDINSHSIRSIAKNVKKYFHAFSTAAAIDEKYHSCFILLEELCGLLLKAVENFSHRVVEDVDKWLERFDRWSKRAERGIIRSYCYPVLQLLTSILNYWEKVAKAGETMHRVQGDMILSMLKLCEKHSTIYGTLEMAKCRCGIENCQIKTDIANELTLKMKCLPLLSRCSQAFAMSEVSAIVEKMVDASFRLLERMKAGNCEQWWTFLQSWGVAVYNMSVSCENLHPTRSIKFYETLHESIVVLQGVETRRRLWSFDDPLGSILHRLSSVCLKNKLYDRAKSVASLNCLLSHDVRDTKAYRDWANVKLKDSTDTDVTVVEYLRSNAPLLPAVSLDDYDLVAVCSRELKALQESRLNMSTAMIAVLRVMESSNCAPVDYVQGVQLLGYHSMSFDTKFSIKNHLRKAASMYEREASPSISFSCAYAMIKFYEFVESATEISRKTEKDMSSALNAITGTLGGSESCDKIEYDVVPAYTAINITVTSQLESTLKRAFVRWRKIVKSDQRKLLSDWEIRYTLHGMKMAGEYARLYRFEDLENEAWRMTYKLANEIPDSLSVVYATSRSLTSPNFQPDWIPSAEHHASEMENLRDSNATEIVTRYRLCLANYWYEMNETDRADELFVKAEAAIEFMRDDANYLLLKDIEMKYRLGRGDEDDQSTYTSIIVGCLYTLLSMIPATQLVVYENKQKQLHDYEIILDHTNRLALRLNSLLSYREISAHLIDRLGIAQKLVTSLRVAECLKFLCYIDLSRGKLDECEAKLQGLEHILEIEAFDVTMKSSLSPYRDTKGTTTNSSNPTRYVDAVRDVGQSDTSPVLRKKVFAKPDFMLHGENCSCFKCTNACYQHLVWVSTYIRAQLFALQANGTAAFQHFHGAMRIRKCILMKREVAENAGRTFSTNFTRLRRGTIEYVMFHLDYCRFLEWSMPNSNDQIRQIALDALELCETYDLHNHPVYMSVNELLFERRFKNAFTKDDYSKFMVPEIGEIDVSRYELGPVPDPTTCVTPMREIIESRPISVRRRKTPPFLKLDRVPGDLNDEKTPTSTKSYLTTTRTRRLRRKISEDYCDDQSENTSENLPKPDIIISVLAEEDEKDSYLPKRSTRKKSSAVKAEKKPAAKKEANYPLAISEATNLIANLQLEPKAGTRRKAQRTAAGNGEKSSTKSLKEIDEVAESCNDKPMDERKKRNSPLFSSTAISEINADTSDQSFVLPSDISVSSEAEEESTIGRRGRTTLRRKVRDLIQSRVSKSCASQPNSSEDEVVVVTRRSARRLNAPKEQNIPTTNIVKRDRDGRRTKDG